MTYQANELDAASSELRLELSESTELGGANGGEVILMRRHWVSFLCDRRIAYFCGTKIACVQGERTGWSSCCQ